MSSVSAMKKKKRGRPRKQTISIKHLIEKEQRMTRTYMQKRLDDPFAEMNEDEDSLYLLAASDEDQSKRMDESMEQQDHKPKKRGRPRKVLKEVKILKKRGRPLKDRSLGAHTVTSKYQKRSSINSQSFEQSDRQVSSSDDDRFLLATSPEVSPNSSASSTDGDENQGGPIKEATGPRLRTKVENSVSFGQQKNAFNGVSDAEHVAADTLVLLYRRFTKNKRNLENSATNQQQALPAAAPAISVAPSHSDRVSETDPSTEENASVGTGRWSIFDYYDGK